MTFPAYPEVKDSGVEWLGEVPVHWSVKPLKYLTNFINGMAFKPNEWSLEGTPIIRIENLNDSESFNFYDGKVDARYHVEKGDLLFGWSGNKGTSFGPYVWGKEGVFYLNQHIFRLVDLSEDKKWLYWALKAVTKTIEDQAHGIIGMVHVTKGKLGGIPVPYLPKKEQQAIAAFLDHETARIGALVEEQQRLIALLKEKRQAVISHAVTKGLDPDVPMKDSGVEWLGEVPAHWRVFRLKQIVTVQGGSTPAKERLDFWGGHIPWVSPKDMKKDRISDSFDHITEKALSEAGLSMIKPGAVLIVVRGMILAHSVPVAITEAPLTINQDMKAVTPCSQLSSEYMLLLLAGIKGAIFNYIDSSSHGTKKLEWERFENMNIPLPKLSEQEPICSKVHEQVRRIHKLIGAAASAIELLQERRSALISAAVTGKIDVRGWQVGQHAEQTEVLLAAEERAAYVYGKEPSDEV